MTWKSTALDTYNLYMEKGEISRGVKTAAFVSNWLVLLSYIVLPTTLIASDQGTSSGFNVDVSRLYGFSISCLVIGSVSTLFLCIRYFNNILFRLESILLPGLSASFAGLINCLFNFAGRNGRNILTGNTAALLSFAIISFTVFALGSLQSHRVLARIKHKEKHSRVVSVQYAPAARDTKSPYSCVSLPSSASTSEYLRATREKKGHSKKQSSSSRKNLLTVLTASVNPAAQSTSTIATFLDNDDGAMSNAEAGNTARKSKYRYTPDCPMTPELRTANVAISVRAPNPAAWKPNATLHSSSSNSGSRTHSRSNSSSVYSVHREPTNDSSARVVASPIIEEPSASTNTLGASGGMNTHSSSSSYATFLPPSSEAASPEDDEVAPPLPSSRHIPTDVRYLLHEANEVLIGFTSSSDTSDAEPTNQSTGHLSLGPSRFLDRCGSPHPNAFMDQLQATEAATTTSQSQSVFLGDLYDCYKYDEESYASEFEKLQQSSSSDLEKGGASVNIEDFDLSSPKSPNREFFVFPEDVRDSIVSTGSASRARRSRNKVGSISVFAAGEGDEVREISPRVRSPGFGRFEGVYI